MLTFRVEKLVPGGYGLARTERGVVLVKGALPGELVRGEPKRKKGALFLEAPEILEAHPGRYPEPPPPSPALPLASQAPRPVRPPPPGRARLPPAGKPRAPPPGEGPPPRRALGLGL